MRKNTARHWLHAGLDLLPLILIPVFMIYSHRHTIDSGSIEVPQNKVADFNQQVSPSTAMEWLSYDGGTYTYTYSGIESLSTVQTQFFNAFTFENGHKYINYFYVDDTPTFMVWDKDAQTYLTWNNNTIYTSDNNHTYDINMRFNNFTGTIHLYYCVFDLTQMFGVGNEPSAVQFNEYFPINAYAYTISKNVLIKGFSTVTYDDTDIMSQFTYQLYNSVDKYFNMGNVFGMSNVYDWFNLNIFGGNASISIYIVWNIVLYEFVMDLLFLLYALFMWFIDVTKRLIEKPLDSIK